MLAGAASLGADAVVFDLEDTVPEAQKAAARGSARRAITDHHGTAVVAVRVNGLDTGLTGADVDAVVAPGLGLVVVPKVEAPSQVLDVGRRLAAAEAAAGLPVGSVGLLAQVETARGLRDCAAIADAGGGRLRGLVLGSADLANDLDVDLDVDLDAPDPGGGLHPVRGYAAALLVVASRAARLWRPIDGPYLDLRDDDGFAADSRRSRRLGFGGRVVLHPRQVEPANAAYAGLDPGDAARLVRVVEAFERAEAEGSAAVTVDGRFVDAPIYRQALRRLADAGHPAARPDER
jgi:citrate lyase subunit beta/citryl-CoA lyase